MYRSGQNDWQTRLTLFIDWQLFLALVATNETKQNIKQAVIEAKRVAYCLADQILRQARKPFLIWKSCSIYRAVLKIFQKTERNLGVYSVKTAKQGITEYFFIWSFGSFNSNFPCFFSLFSTNCSSLLCTLEHLFFTTVSLLNYAGEKFTTSAALQSRVHKQFNITRTLQKNYFQIPCRRWWKWRWRR